MKAMDTKKGPVHINVPLFEPLVPELDNKHFEAGRSPFNVVKPHYSSGCNYDNTSGRSHVNNTGSSKNDSFLAKYKNILILAGPQIDVVEANSILSFATTLQAPILGDPLSNVRRCYNSVDSHSDKECIDTSKLLFLHMMHF